jgi:hypothetical protein
MRYTKHKIWRIRDLNEKYTEVLIAKEGLKYKPGDAVTLYNGDSTPLFIASGVADAWMRLILNRDLFPNFDYQARSLRLNLEIQSFLPELIGEETPNFLLDPVGISTFLSYVSTFPTRKCKVCYLGRNKHHEDWLKHSTHKIVTFKNIKKAKDLYIVGTNKVLEEKAGNLLNTCKKSCLV